MGRILTTSCRALCALLLVLVSALGARAQLHPLDPLSPAELGLSFKLLQAHFAETAELPHDQLLFPLLALHEPDKAELALAAGPARRVEAQVLHWPSNRTWLAELDLATRKVSSLSLLPAGTQPALSGDEYEAAATLLRGYEPWRKAVSARGADPERAHIDVWAPGHVTLSDAQAGRLSHGRATRLARCLSFAGGVIQGKDAARGGQKSPAAARPTNPYVRPLDGLVALVDLNARKIVELSDLRMEQAVSRATGNAAHELARSKPLSVQQPAGSDLKIDGQLVRWGIWQFRVALHPREGLVLYDVRAEAREQLRLIAQRMALSEIYVPYGFGDAEWSWRSAFDVGEYNPGALAHQLEVDRDVPANARFLASTLASSRGPSAGNPSGTQRLARAIALYERSAGVLWSRTDPSSGARDTRMARELVVTWSTWIGNYIYGFDWIFKQDGSIELRVQLTGTTLNRGFTARAEPGAPKVAKDEGGVLIAAPNHQHFFNFRLDLDVDGARNHVMESELGALPETGFANAFDKKKTALAGEGARDTAPAVERKWCVMSNATRNVLGEPPAFTLEPGASIRPYARADFPGQVRAQFAKHALWITRYAAGERFAAGAFPSQAQGSEGLNRYIEPAEALEPARGDDVVLWYTLGLSHVPRLEDYPVMSTESVGFRLVPHGFFDRNPALPVRDLAR